MILLLHACSYVAAIIAFLFVTLSLASGLLYIAEVIEEHSQLAKVVGKRTIYSVIGLQVALCLLDRLPLHLTFLGIVCHVVYLQNFSKTWPYISLTSPKFLLSCTLVIGDHFAWFFYFAERAKDVGTISGRYGRQPYRPAWDTSPRSRAEEPLSFMDVATFFAVCVWLVPFFLFLSLSANDNVLPSQSDNLAGSATTPQLRTPNLTIPTGPRVSMIRAVLDPLLDYIPLRARGYRSSKQQREGILSSPARSLPPSPALSPNPYASTGFNFGTPPAPPPLSPSMLGNGTTATLTPRSSYNSFRDAATARPNGSGQLRQPPPPVRRNNTSPVMTGQRPGTPPVGPKSNHFGINGAPIRSATLGEDEGDTSFSSIGETSWSSSNAQASPSLNRDGFTKRTKAS